MTTLLPDLIADERKVTRERILELQEHVLAMPQLPNHVRHFFVKGLYGRELFVPAGACAVGKIHRHEQITMILGDVTIVTCDEVPVRVTGCETFTTPAGVKRAVYAHADTFITSFHANPHDLRDIDELERHLIAPSFEALAAPVKHEELTP